MDTQKSVVTLVLGVLGLLLVHSSIQGGNIPLRWTSERMTTGDPSFWFYAGCFYGLATVMILLGLIYLSPANRFLPRIDTDDGLSSVAYTCLILVVAGVFGLVLKDILPGIYL